MQAKLITVQCQQFWLQAFPVDTGRWDAAYYRVKEGHPEGDFVTARFNFGDPTAPIDEQVLCTGLACFSPALAEEYAENCLNAFLIGQHQPKIFTGGAAL